ncbi:ComEC/Rec2 family competence protein [Nocardia sp. NPDC052254]|uniref:ComEC/Rec2 family competence protein n=1 Tax=Nocardia sp. NPDC052254 TaxID=3155681 RepID=UPI00343CABFD
MSERRTDGGREPRRMDGEGTAGGPGLERSGDAGPVVRAVTGRDAGSDGQIAVDARLLPAAAACWLVTVLAVVAGWRAGLGAGVLLGVSSLALGVCLVRGIVRGVVRCVVWSVLAAFSVAAGFAFAGAWQEHRVAAHPLRQLPVGSVVTAELVAGDLKPLPARSFGGRQWMMRATVREFRYGTTTVRGGAAVTVITPERIWSELVPGQHVRFRARVDRPWRRDLTVAALRAQGPPSAVGPRTWWQSAAATIRTKLSESAQRALSPDAAGVLPGLIDGDTSHVPDRVRENFQAVDLTHLLAVSGTNVSIVLAAVLLSTRTLTLDPRVGALLAGLALFGFVILARPSPSVLRASVMGAIAVLAIMTGRRKQALPALCVAVLVLVGFSPQLAVDAGFALSVLATAALILLAPEWTRWLERRGWPRAVAEAFGVATAAFVVTTPIIVALTGHLSGVAILANVLVEPVVAPITLLGVAAAVLSCVWQPAAVWVLHLAELPMWWLLAVAEHAAGLGISLTMPAGAGGAALAATVLAAGVAVVALSGSLRRGRRRAAEPRMSGGGVADLSPPTRRIVP